MKDTQRAPVAAGPARAGGWLVLCYVLPARRAQARVQAWRRLQRLGAVALRNSAYVLPDSAEAREDFAWIKKEIAGSGGQATVLAAEALDAATTDEIIGAFRRARAGDFDAIRTAAARLLERLGRPVRGRKIPQVARRLREQFNETVRVDFFGTPERDHAAGLLAQIDTHLRKAAPMRSPGTHTLDASDYKGRLWSTRPRPGVDRMSSAWLIRRFIDPAASFQFTDRPAPSNAVPFDTFDAELGHHGGRCTYETLCARFGITDPRAIWIGRIVHDLDLKEDRFHEPDGATVGRLVEGLRRAHADDQALLGHGIATFEALYQSASAADSRASDAVSPRAGRKRPRPGRRAQSRR
jgi:hypothetical protein